MPDPYRIDPTILSLLAGSKAWVEPTNSKTHPWALTFYVPRHRLRELERIAPAPPGRKGSGRGRARLVLVE